MVRNIVFWCLYWGSPFWARIYTYTGGLCRFVSIISTRIEAESRTFRFYMFQHDGLANELGKGGAGKVSDRKFGYVRMPRKGVLGGSGGLSK